MNQFVQTDRFKIIIMNYNRDMTFGSFFKAHVTGLGFGNCHTLPYGNAAPVPQGKYASLTLCCIVHWYFGDYVLFCGTLCSIVLFALIFLFTRLIHPLKSK